MKKRYLTSLFLLAAAILPFLFPNASAVAAPSEYKRSTERYAVPDVTLINQDGKRVKLKSLINCGKPVVLDFVYATCTTICPVLSAGFSNFQRKLGDKSSDVQLISISIDPEHDSPRVMKKYLRNYRARPGWQFLTGSREDIDSVMSAFDSYVTDKMSHYPIMFIRGPRDEEWVRIYGLISTSDFMHEYEKVVQK
jgi:protein SCO1